MDLAEFNTRMRVLRRQAKEAAIYAGLHKHAEVTGRIPTDEFLDDQRAERTCSAYDSQPMLTEFTATSINERPTPNLKRKCSGSGTGSYSDGRESIASSRSSASSEASSTPASSNSSRRREKIGERPAQSINSARQAMIDAEANVTCKSKSHTISKGIEQ